MSNQPDFGSIRRILKSEVIEGNQFWETALVAIAKRPPFNALAAPGELLKLHIQYANKAHVIDGTSSAAWNAVISDIGARLRERETDFRRTNYDDPARMNDLVEWVARELTLNQPPRA